MTLHGLDRGLSRLARETQSSAIGESGNGSGLSTSAARPSIESYSRPAANWRAATATGIHACRTPVDLARLCAIYAHGVNLAVYGVVSDTWTIPPWGPLDPPGTVRGETACVVGPLLVGASYAYVSPNLRAAVGSDVRFVPRLTIKDLRDLGRLAETS